MRAERAPTAKREQQFWCGAVGIVLSALVAGCSDYDSDFIPFVLTGFDAWVYDDENDEEFYAGRSDASYFSRQQGLENCHRAASGEARRRKLEDWSYMCCTVTQSSESVAKVR